MQACGRLLAKMLVDGWCAQPFAPFLWHVLRDSHEDVLGSSGLALGRCAEPGRHVSYSKVSRGCSCRNSVALS